LVGSGLVSAIKAKINPVEILNQARPQIKLVGLGKRWVTCACPFHEDKAPSFWIDTQRGLWGCHACNIHGDVINLWARFQGLTVAQAVQDLAGKVVTW
jgi:DNA primase